MTPIPFLLDVAGIFRIPSNCRKASVALERATPPPATINGRFAEFIASITRSISPWEGTGRGIEIIGYKSSLSLQELVPTSHGISRWTGPGRPERAKLERLCRYIARLAVSTQRLSLTRNGQVRYELKTPYRNGTTHVIFEPLDFISRLVALIPKPRVNLTRFHGVFA